MEIVTVLPRRPTSASAPLSVWTTSTQSKYLQESEVYHLELLLRFSHQFELSYLPLGWSRAVEVKTTNPHPIARVLASDAYDKPFKFDSLP